jgi:hypothetical protein
MVHAIRCEDGFQPTSTGIFLPAREKSASATGSAVQELAELNTVECNRTAVMHVVSTVAGAVVFSMGLLSVMAEKAMSLDGAHAKHGLARSTITMPLAGPGEA